MCSRTQDCYPASNSPSSHPLLFSLTPSFTPPPSHHSLLSPSPFSLLYYSNKLSYESMTQHFTRWGGVGGGQDIGMIQVNLLWLHDHCSQSWDGWDVTWPMFVYGKVCSCVALTFCLKPAFPSTAQSLKTIYQSNSYYSANLQCIPPDMYLLRLEFSTW